jgi:hypothetical protein
VGLLSSAAALVPPHHRVLGDERQACGDSRAPSPGAARTLGARSLDSGTPPATCSRPPASCW